MPYVTNERKDAIISKIIEDGLEIGSPRIRIEEAVASVGDLNFAITTLVGAYIVKHGLRYVNVNAVVGALECAKLEAYRRVAGPYEDIKISENGDAYPTEVVGD